MERRQAFYAVRQAVRTLLRVLFVWVSLDCGLLGCRVAGLRGYWVVGSLGCGSSSRHPSDRIRRNFAPSGASHDTNMDLRKHTLEAVTLIAAAILCALVANTVASRERKIVLVGTYPN